MIKGLIFDMDGVLIDSEPIYKQLNTELFKKLGFTLSEEEYAQFVGTTDEKMLGDLKERFSLDQSIGEMNTLREKVHMAYFKEADLVPMEGLIDLLKWAEKAGLKLAVASSTDERFVYLILKKLDILEFFEAVVCGNHIARSKPAPDIFLESANKLSVKPESCIVIEDSTNGVKAGKKAGMYVIGFQSDDGSQDLSDSDRRVKSLREAKAQIEACQ